MLFKLPTTIKLEHPLIKEICINNNSGHILLFCKKKCGIEVHNKIKSTRKEFASPPSYGRFLFERDFEAFEKAARILKIDQTAIDQIATAIDQIAKETGNLKMLFLKGNNIVTPSIYVNLDADSSLIKSPVEKLTTEEFIKKNSQFKLATPNMLKIKNMGEIGKGLFAATDIPVNTIIGVFGGVIISDKYHENYDDTYKQNCSCDYPSWCTSWCTYIGNQTSIIGTGKYATDLIQHAFPLEKFQKMLQMQSIELSKEAVGPNVEGKAIRTGYKFQIIYFVTTSEIKKNEIILRDYGLSYVLGENSGMDKMIIFNKNGEQVQTLFIKSRKEQTFSTSQQEECSQNRVNSKP
jgi:hypothetical protein